MSIVFTLPVAGRGYTPPIQWDKVDWGNHCIVKDRPTGFFHRYQIFGQIDGNFQVSAGGGDLKIVSCTTDTSGWSIEYVPANGGVPARLELMLPKATDLENITPFNIVLSASPDKGTTWVDSPSLTFTSLAKYAPVSWNGKYQRQDNVWSGDAVFNGVPIGKPSELAKNAKSYAIRAASNGGNASIPGLNIDPQSGEISYTPSTDPNNRPHPDFSASGKLYVCAVGLDGTEVDSSDSPFDVTTEGSLSWDDSKAPLGAWGDLDLKQTQFPLEILPKGGVPAYTFTVNAAESSSKDLTGVSVNSMTGELTIPLSFKGYVAVTCTDKAGSMQTLPTSVKT